ncbi:MAG: hypothetical protein AAGF32_03050, partial [Pseudomonadota bacterium]
MTDDVIKLRPKWIITTAGVLAGSATIFGFVWYFVSPRVDEYVRLIITETTAEYVRNQEHLQ